MPETNPPEEYPDQLYGWVKENDGTWSLYSLDGTKIISSRSDRAQVSTPLTDFDIASKQYVDQHGGGFSPVSVALVAGLAQDLDIHAEGPYQIAWSQMYDNLWDENPLDAIPDGLGLDFAFDGSSADITTTAAGVWAMSLYAYSRGGADADWVGRTQIPFVEFTTSDFTFVEGNDGGTVSATFQMSGGGTDQFLIFTDHTATANPLLVRLYAVIVRLA